MGILISGNGSTLQALLDVRDYLDIPLVISSSGNAYGLKRAQRAGVPVLVVPTDLRGKENKIKSEEWIVSQFEKYGVQKIFLCGFMKIVSSSFIKKYEGRIFNIHPSKLPKYKGLDSLNEALLSQDQTAGVTIHHVVEDVDSGEYVLQRDFEIPSHRLSNESHLWLHIQEQRVLREALRKL